MKNFTNNSVYGKSDSSNCAVKGTVYMDVLFMESAAGGLKYAMDYGRREYKEPHFFAVIVTKKDGSPVTPEEEREARRQAIEQEKAAWRQAKPVSGKKADIFCLPLALQTGDISELLPGEKRAERLRRLTIDIPEKERDYVEKIVPGVLKDLEKIKKKLDKGESLRIWYSNNPDEYFGMLWFCAWLDSLGEFENKIYTVCLPLWRETPYGKINYSGWGEVRMEYWHELYSPVQLRNIDIKMYANEWKKLMAENGPLRAVINGRSQSVPEDFYDSFIIKEIQKQPEEFLQAQVVGSVIGRYQLGINTGFITARMEKMAEKGMLTPLTQPPEDWPLYHRKMKRNF